MGAEAASLFDDEPTRQVVAAAVSGGGNSGSASRKTVEFERNGGVLRVQVRPLRREDHPGAVVTIEDVTQQRVAVLDAVRRIPHADTDSLISAVRAETRDISHQAVYAGPGMNCKISASLYPIRRSVFCHTASVPFVARARLMPFSAIQSSSRSQADQFAKARE